MNKTTNSVGAKILYFDIENAPHKIYAWQLYDAMSLKLIQPSYMLSFSWKWSHEKTTHVKSLPMYKGYKSNPTNDKQLVLDLHKLMEEAEILIGHNGDNFDIKMAKARFIKYGLDPLSRKRTVDTLKIARKEFRCPSNKLDELGEFFGLGRKVHTGGFSLWDRCMEGDMKAWKLMEKYNKQDVILLEKVYLHMRPWASTHVNINLFDRDRLDACPKCGSDHLQKRGFEQRGISRFQRYQCQSCGGWTSDRKSIKEEKPTKY